LRGTPDGKALPVRKSGIGCGCAFAPAAAIPPGSEVFKDVGSKLRITDMKVFGVTLDEKIARADRPYVFVKLETNQGVVGWGEATLEGKAGAAMACVNDLRDFIVGSDPMQSEHLYQLMYIGSFYRGGPVLGSAISGIDQAIWDIRGKVLGMPVYELLGGPVDPQGVRGYYHAAAWTLEEARALRDQTRQAGVTALKRPRCRPATASLCGLPAARLLPATPPAWMLPPAFHDICCVARLRRQAWFSRAPQGGHCGKRTRRPPGHRRRYRPSPSGSAIPQRGWPGFCARSPVGGVGECA